MGAMPSQPLFDAHGRSESSAVSAMQPDSSANANVARNAPATPKPREARLVGEEDVIGLNLILFPGAENVANHVGLALNLLTETDTADEFAGFAV